MFLEITKARCSTFSKGRGGKLWPAGIGGVLRNRKGEALYMFSKHLGAKDSNEGEILAILEALHVYGLLFQHNLIVESDSSKVIYWVKSFRGLWKQFYFNKSFNI